MKLKDRVAIITGSGRGIGREIALAYAEEGARIVVTARTSPEIEQVAEEIKKLGGKASSIICDVSREDQVIDLIKGVMEKFQRIDILVNNAGQVVNCPVEDMTLQQWNQVINTNLGGTFLCSRAVIPIMRAQGGGIIINMLGRGTRGGSVREGLAAYSSSKGAIEVFTRVLAREVAPYNIRVNNLHPGHAIATRMTLPTSHLDATELQPPWVVRAAAVFLASDENKDLNGEYVNVQEFNQKHGIPLS